MINSKDQFDKIRILIVGSGIIGKFNALELSNSGFNITIVDQNEFKNSSNAALGILMGNIYQKKKGRSWMLRKKSLEQWPKWLDFLKHYNSIIHIEKPLFKLTTNDEQFQKIIKFKNDNPEGNFELIYNNSHLLNQVNKKFKGNKLQGIVSLEDGRIDPKLLLKTLNYILKEKNINTLDDRIIEIKKKHNKWYSILKSGNIIKSEIVILCNSLDSLELINPENYGIKMKPVVGQAIELCCDENYINFLSLPKNFNINGKNLIPLSKQKIIIGSTDEYNFQPEEHCINQLIDFIEVKPDWLNKNKISRKWFGIRSRPEGQPSPILKSLEKGLILCSGFYKNGILLAPACSNWISEEIKNHI